MQTLARLSPWIWILALLNVLLHLVFYQNLEYHRDELLYFSLGMHPAAGYASVPPLVGLLAWVVGSLFGYSLLAVKLLPALASGAMTVLGAAIARELGGERYAQRLAALAMIITPLMLRAFFLYQPVFLDILLWTISFYWVIRFLNTRSPGYLYTLGATLGVGLLNKYLIAILAVCMLIALLLTHRSLFKNRALYGAIGIALLVFSPNLIWQYQRDFPVAQHMAALQTSQLVHVSRAGFLGEQFLFIFSVAPLVFMGLWFLLRSSTYRSVAITALLAVALLCLLRGKSYYTAGVYPTLLAAGAVGWERWLARPALRVLLPLLMTLTILPLLPMGLPIYPVDGLIAYFQRLDQKYGVDAGRRFEDGTLHALPQDYADMLGWEELTQVVHTAYRHTGDKAQVLIYCENYGQAGAIAVIGRKYRLPEPISFHESFLYWAPGRLPQNVQEFIYVNDELGEDIPRLFAEVREVGRIQNPYAREYGTRVYLCRQPKTSIRAMLLAKIPRMTPF